MNIKTDAQMAPLRGLAGRSGSTSLANSQDGGGGSFPVSEDSTADSLAPLSPICDSGVTAAISGNDAGGSEGDV